jgi:hypothetical protein
MNDASALLPRAPSFAGGCWPSEAQRLLLRASLLAGEAGKEAWARWRGQTDFERLDSGSFRMLGLLYRNIASWKLEDPILPRLKGIYRNFWAHNQVLLKGKECMLSRFWEAGIETLLIKGAGLVPTVCQDWGLRPMHDFDLFVPQPKALKAMRLLQEEGWKSNFLNQEQLVHSLHACNFHHPQGGDLDLHWHLMYTDCREGTDDDFWEARIPAQLGCTIIHVLCPADQLLHTCEHGPRYCAISPIRWLADAWKIIRVCRDSLDWDRLVGQAQKRQLVLPVRRTLSYLQEHLDADIPPEVLARLRAARGSLFERAEQRIAEHPLPPVSTVLQRLPRDLCHYWRLKRRAGPVRIVKDFPMFLQHVNYLEQPVHYYIAGKIRHAWRVRIPHSFHRVFHRGLSREGAMEHIDAPDLTGFHLLEPWQGRFFRWSKDRAAIRLRLSPGHYTVVLDLGGIRGWYGDLDQSLEIFFNTFLLPREALFFEPSYRLCFEGESGLVRTRRLSKDRAPVFPSPTSLSRRDASSRCAHFWRRRQNGQIACLRPYLRDERQKPSPAPCRVLRPHPPVHLESNRRRLATDSSFNDKAISGSEIQQPECWFATKY